MRLSSTLSVVVVSLFKEFGGKKKQSSALLAKVLLFSA